EFIEDLTGHSTRRLTPPPGAEPVSTSLETWYLVYKDEEGVMHTVKGSLNGIRRSLREGLLGDASNIRAARAKSGPFESIRGIPEFRDLAMKQAGQPVPGGRDATDSISTNTPVSGTPLSSRNLKNPASGRNLGSNSGKNLAPASGKNLAPGSSK